MPGVVIAAVAQGLAEQRIIRSVHAPAARGAAVLAVPATAPRATGHIAGRAVHGAEAGRGKSDEQPWMPPDAVRDVFAAYEAGSHQVEGVPGVES